MPSLQPMFKEIKLYFEETPFEHIHLETFRHIILSNLASTKRQDKGTWIQKKISVDEAYTEQERYCAMRLSKEVICSFFYPS